jgi:hypothetical protein
MRDRRREPSGVAAQAMQRWSRRALGVRPRWEICSLIPNSFAASAIVMPSPISRSASRSLRMICSGVCRRRFIVEFLPRP